MVDERQPRNNDGLLGMIDAIGLDLVIALVILTFGRFYYNIVYLYPFSMLRILVLFDFDVDYIRV